LIAAKDGLLRSARNDGKWYRTRNIRTPMAQNKKSLFGSFSSEKELLA
jgi:hypothetical protein